ncbi:MAG: Rrf2 family transcriptional regulator [Acidobacteriota bacterium]
MKINTKIRYGLRMMVILAQSESVVNTEILGEKMLVSPKYLRKLAGPIEKAGLIQSVQGKYGGYKLNRDPDKVSISDVFNAYEESLHISGCTKNSGCILSDECITSNLWEYFEKLISKEFFTITIDKIIANKFI